MTCPTCRELRRKRTQAQNEYANHLKRVAALPKPRRKPSAKKVLARGWWCPFLDRIVVIRRCGNTEWCKHIRVKVVEE